MTTLLKVAAASVFVLFIFGYALQTYIEDDLNLSAEEIFSEYFRDDLQDISELEGKGAHWIDTLAQIKFKAPYKVLPKNFDSYISEDCLAQDGYLFLPMFNSNTYKQAKNSSQPDFSSDDYGDYKGKVSKMGYECFVFEKQDNPNFLAKFIYNKRLGWHYFYTQE
jgi:hypothetical protein